MMNEVQLFNFHNEDLRTIKINDEVWFLGNDVAKILKYSNYRKAVSVHVDNDDKLRTQIRNAGQKRLTTFINEPGIYSLIFSSKLDKAKEFKRWVFHKVLPSIRKTGSYSIKNNNNLSKQIQSTNVIKNLTSRIDDLENNIIINTREAQKLNQASRIKVVPLLNGKQSKTYHKFRQKVFANLWIDFKDYFMVSSYKDLPKEKLQSGTNYIQSWQPRIELQSEINSFNNQMDLF